MVYFPLNINEELADLLRSATELNGLLNNYVKEHFKDLEYPPKKIGEMQNSTLDMIATISDFIGDDILSQVHAELKKEEKV